MALRSTWYFGPPAGWAAATRARIISIIRPSSLASTSMTSIALSRSLHLQSPRLRHLGIFIGLGTDEGCEFPRGITDRLGRLGDQDVAHFRVLERVGRGLVQPVEHRLRGSRRRQQAEPVGEIELLEARRL